MKELSLYLHRPGDVFDPQPFTAGSLHVTVDSSDTISYFDSAAIAIKVGGFDIFKSFVNQHPQISDKTRFNVYALIQLFDVKVA